MGMVTAIALFWSNKPNPAIEICVKHPGGPTRIRATDILNHFWIQVVVLLLEPLHGSFRSETAVT
jgi:hypothetical protein